MLIKIREIEEQPEGLRSFGMVGGLLLSPFAKILAGVLLAATLTSVGTAVYKDYQLKNTRIELLETQNKLAHSASELANCHGKVDEQNKHIADLQITAAEDVALVEEINEQLDEDNKKQKKEIEQLKKQTAPLTCEESRNWLKENIDLFGEQP